MGVEIAIYLALMVVGPLVGYFVGSAIERRHYASIRERERGLLHLPVVTFKAPPADWPVTGAQLVSGSVVISLDTFKLLLAALRMMVGGRVRSFESLLDRARREAVLRMKEDAAAGGCGAIINVRFETATPAGSPGGVMGIEVLAYGTGLTLSAPVATD